MGHRVHFLANCCHTCKKLHPAYECEICHMVYYCSEIDRRDNWQAHSQLCRALFKLCQAKGVGRIYEKAIKSTALEFRNLRHAVAMECSTFLQRNLISWELEMIYWPKVCNVCFKQNDNLICCSGCDFVYSCEDLHFNENHSDWCSTLKFHHEVVRHVEMEGVPAVGDFKVDGESGDMTEILKMCSKSRIEQAFLSELLTYPLTIRRAIHKHVPQAECLTIHVVGAELQAEVLPFSKWENYLLHCLPQVQQIDLIFIGPDLQASDGIFLKSEIKLCENCRNSGKKLNYELVCDTVYHDYLKKPSATKPNLISALNAGLYRMIGFQSIDTWTPTLSKMFEQSAPVLITEYTSCEIKKDLNLIEEKYAHAKISEHPGVNPFASVKPNLNIISDEETPVIFKNYFSMVLKADG